MVNNKKRIVNEEILRTKTELEKEIEGIIGEERFESWKKFAFKGQMIQIAVAFMLGAAFKNVITALSQNIIMPIINYTVEFTGDDWREHTYQLTEGLIFETGKFAGSFVDFIIISVFLFIIFRRSKAIFDPPKPEKISCVNTIECKYCKSMINYKCIRCPVCTSWLNKENDNG